MDLLAIGLSIVLMGCSTSQPMTSQEAPGTPTQVAASPVQGQSLPITATAKMAGQVIQLEVARTPEQQATGLMYRSSLADDRGMLFPFSPPRLVGFWMKNVSISLDMIFLRNNVVQYIAANVPPCQTDPCPVYGPESPVDQVIELRGGRAAQLGLKPGDRVSIQFLPDGQSGTPK